MNLKIGDKVRTTEKWNWHFTSSTTPPLLYAVVTEIEDLGEPSPVVLLDRPVHEGTVGPECNKIPMSSLEKIDDTEQHLQLKGNYV